MSTWFPIVIAPAVWLLQTVALWVIAAWGCPGEAQVVHTLSWVVSAVSLVVVVAASIAAASRWRRTPGNGMPRMAGWTRPAFSLSAALLVSGAAVLAVVATALPSVMLAACQGMR